jgi:hypothetical protein
VDSLDMRSMAPGRRGHTFFVTIAQLALVAYLFQVMAFDHWQVDPSHNVAGVEGSQAHVIHDNHCHGSNNSCADGAGSGSAYVKFAEAVSLPAPPSLRALNVSHEAPALANSTFETLTPPPQAV